MTIFEYFVTTKIVEEINSYQQQNATSNVQLGTI